MDMVLVVSALAMALAVAWADWVMSCCGVGSVAMSQTQLVRYSQIRKTGGGHKNGYISETIGWIDPRCAQHLPRGVCYTVEHWQCQGHDDVMTGCQQ